MIYPITPVPKPRMTTSDRWKKRPPVVRYWAFCDEVLKHGVKLSQCGAYVVFWVPMPKSWTKKKRAQKLGKPHEQKPDLSNLLKALEDACIKDDSKIWHYAGLEKRWAEKGSIEIKYPGGNE